MSRSCDWQSTFIPKVIALLKENKNERGIAHWKKVGKNTKDKALDDDFFIKYVKRIRENIHDEENSVRDAMNASLLSIGKRNKKLNKITLQAAKAIGPAEVDYGDTSCEPLDIVKHLTSDRLQKKLKG